MNQSKISVRYAKAIFLLAKEKNALSEVYKDLKLIRETIFDVPEFKAVISSPVIKKADKYSLLKSVYGDKISEISARFLDFVVEKSRESYIMDIAWNFEEFYRKEFNIKEVIITTQTEVSDNIKTKIANMVSDAYKSEVEIKNISNDKMIGGIIIRIENDQLDLSVKTQLEEIKKALRTEEYVRDF